MQTLGKILGLALLQAVVCLTWSIFALPLLNVNLWAPVAISAIPVMLLGGVLAHFWGLWRAGWLVRLATAVTCIVIPILSNFASIISMALFWRGYP